MGDQQAKLEWRDGRIPISIQFDDPYYSLDNGLEETRHVFIQGNDLPDRFCDGFHIAELGFGTGLNLLTAILAWKESGQHGKFQFTSFEAYPMETQDLAAALDNFPQVRDIATPLIDAWRTGKYSFDTDDVRVNVILGDARKTLANWNGKADAWFLDGFSPAKNPELWEESLMQLVGVHTVPRGTFATYTAAGFVRRGLEKAGFDITRVSGFGRKRHMSKGIKQ